MHGCHNLSRRLAVNDPVFLLDLQGKSRSTTAIIAYLMATGERRRYEESLRFVQEKRRMASPNPTFTKKLQDFARSDTLKRLRKEL